MVKKKKVSKEKNVAINERRSYPMLKGLIWGCVFTAVTFFIMALVLTYSNLSEGCIAAVSVVITSISAIIAGYFTAKGMKSRGLLWGISAGIFYCLIVFVVMLSGGQEFVFSVGKATGIICSAAGGGIGGILGINTKK